jgi:hypothetical protein
MGSSLTAPASSLMACPTSPAPLPAGGEDWSLVTAPDEQRRCSVVVRAQRCEHATSFRVAGANGALDDYTCVCRCHLELVRRPDDIVTSLQFQT